MTPVSENAVVPVERSETANAHAARCRVSTCWHRALPDSDLCAGCYADAMEDAEAVPSADQADGSSVPPTQDDDMWMEATIEETESEWWL
jgi:hypothetical protein